MARTNPTLAPAHRQAAAVASARQPATLELEYPIQAHGEEVRQLEFRPLVTGDLLATDGLGDVAKACKLVELLASIPPSSVRQLDPVDFKRCAEVIGRFLESSPATGRRR